MAKWLIFLFLGVLILLTLQTKPIVVDSAQVIFAPMKVTTEEEGKTRVIDRFSITAPIDAFMQRIELSAGDPVKKGQTLIVLEPLPSSVLDPSSHSQAEAVLGASEEMENIIKEISAAAKADQDLAEINFKRSQKLRQNKAIAEHELDIAKIDKRRSEAVYRASQFGWVFSKYLTKISHSALDYENVRQTAQSERSFKISSTTDGKILKLSAKSERVVKAGEFLMEIGDVKHLEVEVEVLSTIAVKLKPLMLVELDHWGGDQTLYGKVKTIEASAFTKISALGVEEQRVKVIVSINLQDSEQQQMAAAIGDGFRVESRFILWQSEKVLQIPNSALFIDQLSKQENNNKKNWAVYVIKDGKLQKRVIKIGHKNHLMTEVIDGINETDTVVRYLSNDLDEGLKVEFR